MGELNFRVTRWLNKVYKVNSCVALVSTKSASPMVDSVAHSIEPATLAHCWGTLTQCWGTLSQCWGTLANCLGLRRSFGARKHFGGESNSPEVAE
eukprot:3570787-Pyramimonas_sp.AAC.1